MNILIYGGSGFIGSHLSEYLSQQNHVISIYTRNLHNITKSDYVSYYINSLSKNDYYDIIINLAGEPVNKKRWNEKSKKIIYQSRIDSTRNIIDFISNSKIKPKLFINASAIGFYGHSEDKIFTEDSSPEDFDFAHQICADTEKLSKETEKFNVRTCQIRIGIVLGLGGGILKEIAPIFKLGLGASLGTGKQIMSWIHINDLVGSIEHIIKNEKLHGPINLTSPNPVSNKVFSKNLAASLNRPCFLSIPSFVVRILFGQMADSLLLKGQNVYPKKLKDSLYNFQYADLKKALDGLLN